MRAEGVEVVVAVVVEVKEEKGELEVQKQL